MPSPLQLVLVVGDVAGDVGEPSVLAPKDPVHVVAELGGSEPEGPLLPLAPSRGEGVGG